MLTKPFEWGMTYLQIASVKRWAPDLLPHVTVLAVRRRDAKACEAHPSAGLFLRRKLRSEVREGSERR